MQRKNSKNKKSRFTTGFTIIEMMVAISIFLIVVTMGIGALLNANSIHKKSSDTRSIMDNLSFIMEEMSRNLRTGYGYRCVDDNDFSSNLSVVNDCLTSGLGIVFESASGVPVNAGILNDTDQWIYKIKDGNISKSIDSGVSWVQLNSFDSSNNSGVKIDDNTSGFVVSGSSPSDTLQPFVIIKLSGKITSNNVSTPFALQTSVSQRSIDLPVVSP